MPKLSVVVPCYNHLKYLPQRMMSIEDQHLVDCELILLDDASTDGSREWLASYADAAGARFVPNEANSGSPFVQWNKGVALAGGDYVWLAESDDEAMPNFARELLGILDSDDDVVVAYAQSAIIDEHGAVLGSADRYSSLIDRDHWQADFVADGKKERSQYMAVTCTMPNASAVIFRRNAFLDVGGADESLRIAGDWDLWYRILGVGKVGFVAKPLNRFRTHGATTRSNVASNGHQIVEHYEVLRRIHSGNADISQNVRERAKDLAAKAVLIQLTRGGGWLNSQTRSKIIDAARGFDPQIVRRLCQQFPVEAIRYVQTSLTKKTCATLPGQAQGVRIQ